MTKYLVTGGAGFIGSNFVKYLYENETDIHITVLDKLTYSGNMDNLAEVVNREDFKFVKGDICDAGLVEELMTGIHVVVNFAAEVAVDRSIDQKQSFLMTDVIGVYVLLEQALKISVPTSGSTLYLCYKAQPVNAVYGTNRFLL